MKSRWDNPTHYPNLPGFPHHLRDGDENNLLPGEPTNPFSVLDPVADRLE